jgi:hypothetical protein
MALPLPESFAYGFTFSFKDKLIEAIAQFAIDRIWREYLKGNRICE